MAKPLKVIPVEKPKEVSKRNYDINFLFHNLWQRNLRTGGLHPLALRTSSELFLNPQERSPAHIKPDGTIEYERIATTFEPTDDPNCAFNLVFRTEGTGKFLGATKISLKNITESDINKGTEPLRFRPKEVDDFLDEEKNDGEKIQPIGLYFIPAEKRGNLTLDARETLQRLSDPLGQGEPFFNLGQRLKQIIAITTRKTFGPYTAGALKKVGKRAQIHRKDDLAVGGRWHAEAIKEVLNIPDIDDADRAHAILKISKVYKPYPHDIEAMAEKWPVKSEWPTPKQTAEFFVRTKSNNINELFHNVPITEWNLLGVLSPDEIVRVALGDFASIGPSAVVMENPETPTRRWKHIADMRRILEVQGDPELKEFIQFLNENNHAIQTLGDVYVQQQLRMLNAPLDGDPTVNPYEKAKRIIQALIQNPVIERSAARGGSTLLEITLKDPTQIAMGEPPVYIATAGYPRQDVPGYPIPETVLKACRKLRSHQGFQLVDLWHFAQGLKKDPLSDKEVATIIQVGSEIIRRPKTKRTKHDTHIFTSNLGRHITPRNLHQFDLEQLLNAFSNFTNYVADLNRQEKKKAKKDIFAETQAQQKSTHFIDFLAAQIQSKKVHSGKWSPEKMERLLRDWDQELKLVAAHKLAEQYGPDHIIGAEHQEIFPADGTYKGYTFERITKVPELRDEGVHMGHCVFSYLNSIEAGNCAIYRVYKTGLKDDCQNLDRATLELNPEFMKFRVGQVRGIRNLTVPKALEAAVNEWTELQGILKGDVQEEKLAEAFQRFSIRDLEGNPAYTPEQVNEAIAFGLKAIEHHYKNPETPTEFATEDFEKLKIFAENILSKELKDIEPYGEWVTEWFKNEVIATKEDSQKTASWIQPLASKSAEVSSPLPQSINNILNQKMKMFVEERRIAEQRANALSPENAERHIPFNLRAIEEPNRKPRRESRPIQREVFLVPEPLLREILKTDNENPDPLKRKSAESVLRDLRKTEDPRLIKVTEFKSLITPRNQNLWDFPGWVPLYRNTKENFTGETWAMPIETKEGNIQLPSINLLQVYAKEPITQFGWGPQNHVGKSRIPELTLSKKQLAVIEFVAELTPEKREALKTQQISWTENGHSVRILGANALKAWQKAEKALENEGLRQNQIRTRMAQAGFPTTLKTAKELLHEHVATYAIPTPSNLQIGPRTRLLIETPQEIRQTLLDTKNAQGVAHILASEAGEPAWSRVAAEDRFDYEAEATEVLKTIGQIRTVTPSAEIPTDNPIRETFQKLQNPNGLETETARIFKGQAPSTFEVAKASLHYHTNPEAREFIEAVRSQKALEEEREPEHERLSVSQ